MSCRKNFWKNSVIAMYLLEKNFSEVPFKDLRPIIMNKIKFECKNHTGPMYPIYYTMGIPSFVWKCRFCLE